MNVLRLRAIGLLGFLTVMLLGGCGGGGGGGSGLTLTSIDVTPANPSVRFGTTLQLTATGYYSDGSTEDLTASATWTASTDNVTVDGAGLVTGAEIGGAAVTASLGPTTGSTAVSVIGVVSLPQTGQTACYDDASTRVDCTTAGIPAGQDGAKHTGVTAPDPRFVVNDCGTPDTSDDVVSDNLTGLMWARNANLPNGTRSWQGALDFIANELDDLCGFTDWRLPNRKELRTLVDYGEANSTDSLKIFINVQAVHTGPYWSSTSFAGGTDRAWFVDMSDGRVSTNLKSNAIFIWPVRAGQAPNTAFTAPASLPETGQITCHQESGLPIACTDTGQDGELRAGAAWPSPRFVAGSGVQADCVTDRLTGLMWVRAPDNVERNWVDALAHAENVTPCGFGDWRLPNVNELESLVNLGVLDQAAELNAPTAFSSVQADFYWSSTSHAGDPARAWGVFMNDGGASALDKTSVFLDKVDVFFLVWPVRAGQ